MQRLNVKLLLALQLDEAHRWSGRGFRNCLRVTVVVFLGFDVRAHIFRWHELHRVTLGEQQAAEIMGTTAGLHRNRARHIFRRKTRDTRWSHPSTQHYRALFIQRRNAAAVLA